MTIELEVSAALRHLALDETIKAYVLQHPPLYQALLQAALRFIGGETLDQCVQIAQAINRQGVAVSIDYMGESTRDLETAEAASQEFLKVIAAIVSQKLDASVSYDLSHVGMVIDPELGYKNARVLALAAQEAGLEMMISMEGPDRTGLILDTHARLCAEFDNIGITLQAFLYRTPADLETVLERPGKIRLVKGAYDIPGSLGLPRGPELEAVYLRLAQKLVQSGHSCSIATHDPNLLDAIHQFIEGQGHPSGALEFEMLKGVTPDRLQGMQERGYRTRLYLPYGQEWYLYLCNRLAEFPPNVYQAIIDAVRHSHS
jgi:proline dehydrogenase